MTAPSTPQAKAPQPSPRAQDDFTMHTEPPLTVLTRSHKQSPGCPNRHGPQCLPQPRRLCTSRSLHLECLPLHPQPHTCVQQTQPSLWPSSDVSPKSPSSHRVWLSWISQKYKLCPLLWLKITLKTRDKPENKSQGWFILAVALRAQSARSELSSRSHGAVLSFVPGRPTAQRIHEEGEHGSHPQSYSHL